MNLSDLRARHVGTKQNRRDAAFGCELARDLPIRTGERLHRRECGGSGISLVAGSWSTRIGFNFRSASREVFLRVPGSPSKRCEVEQQEFDHLDRRVEAGVRGAGFEFIADAFECSGRKQALAGFFEIGLLDGLADFEARGIDDFCRGELLVAFDFREFRSGECGLLLLGSTAGEGGERRFLFLLCLQRLYRPVANSKNRLIFLYKAGICIQSLHGLDAAHRDPATLFRGPHRISDLAGAPTLSHFDPAYLESPTPDSRANRGGARADRCFAPEVSLVTFSRRQLRRDRRGALGLQLRRLSPHGWVHRGTDRAYVAPKRGDSCPRLRRRVGSGLCGLGRSAVDRSF